MSGNTSRKHKQYQLMKEHRKLIGDISAKDEYGRLDLVALGASQGRIITSSPKYDLGRIPIKIKRRNAKAL